MPPRTPHPVANTASSAGTTPSPVAVLEGPSTTDNALIEIKQFTTGQDLILLQEMLAIRPWERVKGEVLSAYAEIASRMRQFHRLETTDTAVYRRANKLLTEFK